MRERRPRRLGDAWVAAPERQTLLGEGVRSGGEDRQVRRLAVRH
jgi:hypothetical protein